MGQTQAYFLDPLSYVVAKSYNGKYNSLGKNKLLAFLEVVRFCEHREWKLENVIKEIKKIELDFKKQLEKDPLLRASVETGKRLKRKRKELICPECKSFLNLTRINIPSGKGNRNGYKSFLDCPKCSFEFFSSQIVAEILEDKRWQ